MAKESIDKLSAATLSGGAVIEALDYELQRSIDNIIDPNTKADGVRTINLQIKIKPKANRQSADVSFLAKSTLQSAQAVETTIFIHESRGVATASEYEQPKQHQLLPENVSKVDFSATAGQEG